MISEVRMIGSLLVAAQDYARLWKNGFDIIIFYHHRLPGPIGAYAG